MQLFLNIFEQFSSILKIKFNPSKSVLLNGVLKLYDGSDIFLFLNNRKIPIVEDC